MKRSSSNRGSATTELMILILAVAVMAAVAAPVHSSGMEKERLAESDASLACIRTQLNSYFNMNGSYPVQKPGAAVIGSEWNDLEPGSLDGRYFNDASYIYLGYETGKAYKLICTGDDYTRTLDETGTFYFE